MAASGSALTADVDLVVGVREQPGHARDAGVPVQLAGRAGALRLRQLADQDLEPARARTPPVAYPTVQRMMNLENIFEHNDILY